MNRRKILLTFAGFDPSSGAGVLLDMKAFHSAGFHGAVVVTSLTAQNTKGVISTFCPPPDFIWKQYQALREDMTISGIKVGMLGCKNNLAVLSKILSENTDIPKVIDPVFRSTSGNWLFDENAVPDFMESIREKATLLTPNIHEATLITDILIKDTEGMKTAAEKIFDMCGFAVLIKGGHLEKSATDILYDGQQSHIFRSDKITKNVHGTGCFLSSNILAHLVMGDFLEEACAAAIAATRKAIKKAEPIGRGQHLIPFSIS